MAEVATLVGVPAVVLDPSGEAMVVALSFGNAIVVDWSARWLVALVLAGSVEEAGAALVGAALVVGMLTAVLAVVGTETWVEVSIVIALLDVVGAATGAEASTALLDVVGEATGAEVSIGLLDVVGAATAVVEESTIGMTVIPGAEDVAGAWL